jgi:hypothetical protein
MQDWMTSIDHWNFDPETDSGTKGKEKDRGTQRGGGNGKASGKVIPS